MPGTGAPRSVAGVFRPLRTYQLVIDIGIAAVFALVMLPLEVGTASGAAPWIVALPFAPLVVGLGTATVFGGALALRRLSPALSLALAWVGAILQMLCLLGPSPVDIAIFAVLYATAAYGSRAVFWIGFASAFLGAIAITVYLFAVRAGARLDQLTPAIAVLAAATFALLLAWTSGALVRTALRARATRLAQEAAEIETIAEQERVRIARDMHDVVAHSLAVVIAQADGARYAAADPGATERALTTISSTARSALADVRLLLTQLRHQETAGPQPTLADLEELYAGVRAAGVELRVDVDPAPPGTPPAGVQLAVYRILQEALTNALRHGGTPLDVALAWHPDHVELAVRNPLRAGAAAPAHAGHGIIGMRERAQLVGGRLDAGPADGEFAVSATLPIGAAS